VNGFNTKMCSHKEDETENNIIKIFDDKSYLACKDDIILYSSHIFGDNLWKLFFIG
jgi:hypothetical protein